MLTNLFFFFFFFGGGGWILPIATYHLSFPLFQIVFQVEPEVDGHMHVRSASNRECMVPVQFLVEV